MITSNSSPPTTPPITGASSVPEDSVLEDGVPTSNYKAGVYNVINDAIKFWLEIDPVSLCFNVSIVMYLYHRF